MTRRSLFAALAALALVAWVGTVSFAKDDATHEGTVVSERTDAFGGRVLQLTGTGPAPF